MITFFEATLAQFIVHHIGNPLQDERYSLSDEPIAIEDNVMNSLLMHFFLSPFQKSNEVFEFMHPAGDLQLNEMHSACHDLFNGVTDFNEASQLIAQHLYTVSSHPKIKSGELYVVLFDNLQIEGELLQAIGVFKSETKESYLKVSPAIGRFDMSYEQEAINIDKLDKGCLIFNTNAEGGYKVAVIDNTSKSYHGYWIDEFLMLKNRQDDFSNTTDILTICKTFVKHKLDDEFEVTQSDKSDLLNRTAKYFKEKETFDLEEFTGEVLGNDQAAQSFKRFKELQEADYDMVIPDTFEISEPAVKSSVKGLKNVLKLDRNFKLELIGNKQLIERGYDSDKGLNFYKVYFKEETA